MSPLVTIITFSNFALPLALILGLVLAFPWIRRLAVYYPLPEAGGKSQNPVILLLAWLVLGALLSGPFVELLNIFHGIAITINLYPYTSPSEPRVAFGLTYQQFQIFASILTTFVVYSYILWIGERLYLQGQLAFLDRLNAGRFERLMFLLVLAGLLNRALDLVWWGLERGLSYFMDQWVILRMIIALGVLAFLVLNLVIILGRRLEPTEEPEEEEWEEDTSYLL
jgi:hypothetical protein